MTFSFWTPEKDAELTRLRVSRDPVPFSECAAILGVSRNACIGRARRLGLRDPRSEVERHVSRRRQPGSVPKPRPKPAPRPRLSLVARLNATEPPPTTAIRFLDRVFRKECAFIFDSDVPIGERQCCGAPILPGAGMEFCAYHLGKVYSTTTQREIKALAA